MTITAGQKGGKSLFVVIDGRETRFIKNSKGNWICYDDHADPLRGLDAATKQAILDTIKRAPGVTIII